jgi:peptidoglycan/xylan/chitin deacetylase (PgdA/CDA1 family)
MTPGQRLAVKRGLARVCAWWPRPHQRRVIVTYHAVGSGPWSTDHHRFIEQIEWLAANAHVRTVRSLLEEAPTPHALQVALTFDDGYQSVLTRAADVLAGTPAQPTLFVTTSQVAEAVRATADPGRGYYPGEAFLLWDEVRSLRDRGWDIGSHGTEHPDLTRVPDRVTGEMAESKRTLEQRLGAPCDLFAYPFGRHNAGVRAQAAAAGYRWALAAVHGTVGPRVDPYAVPRIDIRNDYDLADFVSVVRGDWDFLHWVQATRHAVRVR